MVYKQFFFPKLTTDIVCFLYVIFKDISECVLPLDILVRID